MAFVTARVDKNTGERETVESLCKRFKKQVLKEDILYECKRREYFVKKAVKRRLKSEEAQRRLRRKGK